MRQHSLIPSHFLRDRLIDPQIAGHILDFYIYPQPFRFYILSIIISPL